MVAVNNNQLSFVDWLNSVSVCWGIPETRDVEMANGYFRYVEQSAKYHS